MGRQMLRDGSTSDGSGQPGVSLEDAGAQNWAIQKQSENPPGYQVGKTEAW